MKNIHKTRQDTSQMKANDDTPVGFEFGDTGVRPPSGHPGGSHQGVLGSNWAKQFAWSEAGEALSL